MIVTKIDRERRRETGADSGDAWSGLSQLAQRLDMCEGCIHINVCV